MIYKKLDKLQPTFRKKVESLINQVESFGVFITETWRSDERQAELYSQGKSYLDGQRQKSMHQLGLAIDIAFRGDELYPNDYPTWRKVADIAKQCQIDWGYDLWHWDMPHFQDNGKVYESHKRLYDSEKQTKWCVEQGIFRDEEDLQRILDSITSEQILKNADLIKELLNTGLTKERWALLIYNLKN